jgi:hypothetical protein
MAGHSRPKDGIALLAYVPAIHASFFAQQREGVDARHKAGHDELRIASLTAPRATRDHRRNDKTRPGRGSP